MSIFRYLMAIPNLLLIDSDPAHADVFMSALLVLGSDAFSLERLDTLSAGLDRLRQNGIWAVFVNLFLPDSRGIKTFTSVIAAAPHTTIVIHARSEDESLVGE